MNWWEAALLGVVQGITEFLPVSSSGHLILAQKMLGFSAPPVFFDVLVHVATLLAVVVYFWKRWFSLTKFHFKLVIIATLPAVVAGLVLNPYLETIFNSLTVVGIGWIFCAGLLWSTRKENQNKLELNKFSTRSALIVGLFQALAITPGISRSGSTVVAGLHQGLKKSEAFFFSFLLSVPAIFGALALQLLDGARASSLNPVVGFVGFGSAAVFGLGSLYILEKIIKNSLLHRFAFYCLILGLTVLVFGYK